MMKKNNFLKLIGAITLVLSLPINAQNTRALHQLWQQTLETYPGLQAQNEQVATDFAKHKTNKSSALPQLKLQAQNTYGTFEGTSGAFFPQSGFFNVSGNPELLEGGNTTMNTFGSAVIEWEIFSFGKHNKATQAANANYKKAIIQRESYILELKKELSTRYINLLNTESLLHWTKRRAQRLSEIQLATTSLATAGLRPAADTLLANSSYLQALSAQDYWTGNSKNAMALLEEITGNKQSYEILPLDTYLAATLLVPHEADLIIEENHPILETFDYQAKAYELESSALKKEMLPSLKLMGGYALRGSGIGKDGVVSQQWKEGFNNTTDNYLAGIGLTWNLSNLFTSKHKGNQLKHQALKTNFIKTQYQQNMQAMLEGNQAQIQEQEKQLSKAIDAVDQAKKAYEMYVARYKSGLISLSELLQIQLLLEQSEKTHVDASYSYWKQLIDHALLTNNFDKIFNNL